MKEDRKSRNRATHYGQLTYDKKGKNTHQRKSNFLSNQWCSENQIAICKRINFDHSLTSSTKKKIKKWIKDLYVRPDTRKLLEEIIGKTLSDINHSRIFYDPPPRTLEIKAKINKWGHIYL